MLSSIMMSCSSDCGGFEVFGGYQKGLRKRVYNEEKATPREKRARIGFRNSMEDVLEHSGGFQKSMGCCCACWSEVWRLCESFATQERPNVKMIFNYFTSQTKATSACQDPSTRFVGWRLGAGGGWKAKTRCLVAWFCVAQVLLMMLMML